MSSLDSGGSGAGDGAATERCVGVECSHERCSNMTSMYKVVKTVTSTKLRHEPFTDFYEVHEEIGRWVKSSPKTLKDHIHYCKETSNQ